ncbi:undecaprenyl-diphosphate phosphatase [Candidatus Nitrosacidococcus sp. I8]|uniref:undecaprenyl-diphosphate phosphatase n=1 Tax=Candidatus Nitrosacidococcus sp. I8 TaxID=2942908 RepID=UPI00222621D4|nr:undecaprenyl-diphosphate phosphatase [Candidatus Nitrosacidococcus sp. I8]CAH9015542.1 Undecaprenyl-diphosphatase [Candidatus Nitrosacidococcus sp. I8]
MEFTHTLALAILQGLTEFLPISSSAHLVLLPKLFGWQDQGVAFDVVLHLGTLSAVIFYFRSELSKMTKDWFKSLVSFKLVGESRLAWAVLFGTVPVGLVGLMVHDVVDNVRSATILAWSTIIFGLLLGYADIEGNRTRDEHSLTWKDVVIIGLAQAVALIPGTSRSGITMTAGLMLGLTREGAARFSFLLSIPVIILAGSLEGFGLLRHPEAVDWSALVLGTLISALVGYLCIHFFLKALQYVGMVPFMIYRLILGGIILWLL